MFNSFKRKPPQISIFHNPSSPPSLKALELLRKSNTSPYPPTSSSSKPLVYDLDIVESPPTKDQLQTILSYMPSKATDPALAFLSAHPSAAEATGGSAKGGRAGTLEAIAELARKNANSVKWPVVVDWDAGRASVGSVEGVREILEGIRKVRDGDS